ncbi:MAG TPA: GAF domain-containing sensor histidine kinase [Dermatophilaceae bacterium]
MTSQLWQMLATPVAFDLGALARAFAEETRSTGAVIQLSDGAQLTVGGLYPPDPAAQAALVVLIGQGVTGLVARNGHGMRLGADRPRSPVHRHLLGLDHGGSVARLCVPARGLGGQILGVVGVHRGVDDPYTDADLTSLQPCADLLGLHLQVMDLRNAVDAHRDDRDRLIAQAISAQEAERRRIASDLHDGVTTAIASMSFHLNAAELSIEAAEAECAEPSEGTRLAQARSQIGVARTLADRAYTQTRAAITGLHSLVLDDLGLVAALESLAETAPDAVMEAVCDPAEEFADLPDHTAAALFRIAQESTSNAIRHGHASRVTVSLRRVGGGVVLGISDDGVGFDVRPDPTGRAAARAAGTEGAHFGLSSIAERCALVGASLRIESMPGHGTTVIVDLPVVPAPDLTG